MCECFLVFGFVQIQVDVGGGGGGWFDIFNYSYVSQSIDWKIFKTLMAIYREFSFDLKCLA